MYDDNDSSAQILRAVLRWIDPSGKGRPILFSRVAQAFVTLCGSKFQELFGQRPAEWESDYEGDDLEFSRDENGLLQVARLKGRTTIIRVPPRLEDWFSVRFFEDLEGALVEPTDECFDDLIFQCSSSCHIADLDAVYIAYLQAYGEYCRQNPDARADLRKEGVSSSNEQFFASVDPDETCFIESVHPGKIVRVTRDEKGLIAVFSDPQGVTGYLPIASLSEAEQHSVVVGYEGNFKIVGRKGSRLLLNLDSESECVTSRTNGVVASVEYPQTALAGIVNTATKLQRFLEEAKSIEDPSGTVDKIAERAIRKTTDQIIALAASLWNGRKKSESEILAMKDRSVLYCLPKDLVVNEKAAGDQIDFDGLLEIAKKIA